MQALLDGNGKRTPSVCVTSGTRSVCYWTGERQEVTNLLDLLVFPATEVVEDLVGSYVATGSISTVGSYGACQVLLAVNHT
jgi:hypothetical protein